MNEHTSKKLALGLLSAVTTDDLKKIFNAKEFKEYFDNSNNWSPYGGEEGNWGSVGNQQSSPVGSFVELVINSIDAILLRKASEHGIKDPRSVDAPQSMIEAVKKFYPWINEGKISKLEGAQRKKLAKETVQIGIKRGNGSKFFPTYTIVDFGEGQSPEKFVDTFVSLKKRNKNGINFVQGKFNMGSTGALRFCTKGDIDKGHIKLIISKRINTSKWGWTIVRVREPHQNESLNVAEFFYPNNQIPSFESDSINAFNDDELGVINQGSIVKLFEYDIGSGARDIDPGLRYALSLNLIDCPLPVYICDFDAEPVENKGALRKKGIADAVFSGLNVALNDESQENLEPIFNEEKPNKRVEFTILVEDINDEELGQIKIFATGISKMQDYLQKQNNRVFYTMNGQAQSTEKTGFISIQAGLPELQNHLIVNVTCEGLNNKARNSIFFGDRERMASVGLGGKLRKLVANALKDDSTLREYANIIRLRRATEQIEDTEETKDLLKDMVNTDPALKELFGFGEFITDIDTSAGKKDPFIGKKYPSFIKPQNLLSREDGLFFKELPINAARKIECETDAENEYLSRIDSPGEKWCSLTPSELPFSLKLKNGKARFTIKPSSKAKVGDEIIAQLGFKDYGKNISPLVFNVLIKIIDAETKINNPPGKPTDTKPDDKKIIGEPKFNWVEESHWDEHGFDDNSGAYVSKGQVTEVFINRSNRHLKAILAKEKDEAQRRIDENIFKLGLGLFAIAIHKRISTNGSNENISYSDDPDTFTKIATSSIAPYIISVTKKLGGNKFLTTLRE